MDQRGALPIYINCYTTREMRAFFARQQWCRCKTSERYQVRGTEIEQRWSVVERRIEEVGPQLRYVFDDKGYHEVCNDISVALSYFCASDMARYTSIILCRIQRTEYRRTDEIIKLVRVANDPVDDCLFFPISAAIGAKLKILVVNYFLRRSYLVMAFEMPGLAPEVLREFSLCAFMSESAVNKMVKKMKCLPSASPCPARESVLKRLKAAAACAVPPSSRPQDWWLAKRRVVGGRGPEERCAVRARPCQLPRAGRVLFCGCASTRRCRCLSSVCSRCSCEMDDCVPADDEER
ncbi:putative retrotransposon hot spot protein 4 (RHS4) [Trypanosoma vivax]|uniref:Retrotransposon hot spot protein,C-terminal domain-containing protein n=1 Tax=Trypanosoma vivax (strain Y486) TaxID=1055687 RepID=F9WKA1_TRYVY|nr:putative retrotransposon hot spot protein 4 (RHS4) [Trypanosoma vivax]CCD17921.1 hypothetical protein, conserved in T. vivax [Trypanosoma vivax Y486]|eukprot:CCD17921.1 hypothetical protein, conserved in T. vivax [Trypanosoma vivax Y486]